MTLALGIWPCTCRTSVGVQQAGPLAVRAPDPKLDKRIEGLDKAIKEHVEAGRIAEAIPPAREKRDLLVRLRGADDWRAGDARRDVEIYEALATRPRAIQDRYAEARRGQARTEELFDQGQYARASELCRKTIAILQEILGEVHTDTATSYRHLAVLLLAEGKYAEAEAMYRRALAIESKALGEGHPRSATSYDELAEALRAQGKLAEAEATVRRALEIDLKALGEGDPDTASCYYYLANVLEDEAKHVEAEAMHRRALAIRLKALGEDHPDTAKSYGHLAGALWSQGKYAEAEEMQRRALAINLKALGEDHPETATSYSDLAGTLWSQGKYAGAEPMFRRVLAIYLKTLGEGHPNTAISYNNLAATLAHLGKYAEAESMLRHSLAINLKAVGKDHPFCATSYNMLATTLWSQGKYAEAEATQRRALSILIKVFGEASPDAAHSYNNLAVTLRDQGRYAEAEAMHARALAIQSKALGEGHPDTAKCYTNLAEDLRAQGKHAEAEPMLRRALAIQSKAVGEAHPETARSYNALALSLRAQGKLVEAEAVCRLALAIESKVLGESHPDTATSYYHLALILQDQGKGAEAEAMHRRALEIYLKAVGGGHPHTAASYDHLASALESQGKYDAALRTWRLAVASDEQARLFGPTGLEASLGAGSAPPGLAAALARAGRPREAWEAWERGLARGVVDEVTRRAARPLNDEERGREAELLGRGQALDERINKMLAAPAPTREQEKALDDLRQQASEVRRRLLDLERQLEAKYGAQASRPATLAEAQKAIPEGTALVGWVDTESQHWACLLGHAGEPAWVRLVGSGKDGAWTKEDDRITERLRSELDPETTRGKAGPPAEALARQRLEPLKGHLAGLRRLIVVNSPAMAGVPVEILLAARADPAWDAITVSYAPSAAMLGYLAARPVPRDRPAMLLAVADPAYPQPKADAPAPEPPGAGLAVARAVPNGNADLNGIREGDILLSYAGTELKQAGDLKPVADDGGPRKVPVRYWREGIVREAELAAGRLGVVMDPRPPSAFVRARREAQRVLLGMRGGSHARLPGTRREVEAIAGLFPGGRASVIVGPQACESTLQGMARSGRLKTYRYLHFATHGQSDARFAYRTALILAPDPDTGADPSASESDGTITAEQIARTWELDSDLVVLSACESGLGRSAGAEGYLGFAQPLFARGARSLVLSQWKVDDDATALLMVRFYGNLLGRREGLKAPMPKAEALGEAKRWLRGADRSDVGEALAALPRGTIVRREPVRAASSAHPYEDPTYWAGFILVGAPD